MVLVFEVLIVLSVLHFGLFALMAYTEGRMIMKHLKISKNCPNCKHTNRPGGQSPCRECFDEAIKGKYIKWE